MIELIDQTGELTVMDLLQAIYEFNKELIARVVADCNRIRYNPHDQLVDIACPDVPLIVHLADEQYSKELLRQSADKVAIWQETNGPDLLENKYTFINQL